MKPAVAFAVAVRVAVTVAVAVIGWILAGYLATVPLGALFGWSGHPAIPDAPIAVYVALYLVVLPVLCGILGWKLTGWAAARWRRRESK